MASLITLDRAQQAIKNFNCADGEILERLISAASNIIELYCNRTFAVTNYDELYDGTGYTELLLDHYPVVNITQIMYALINVCQIRNTDLTNARAYWRIDATNLTLYSVKNGITTTTPILLSTCPTIADLATAINLISGWSALALGIYGGFSTTDVRPPQGANDALRGTPYLYMHSFNFWDYQSRPEMGEIVSWQGFQRGYHNFRVIYRAGFADPSDSTGNTTLIPEAIQQACAELAAAMYYYRGINPYLQSESLGEYSYTRAANLKYFDMLSAGAIQALSLYKSYRAPKFRLY